jgi:hypothetical protein
MSEIEGAANATGAASMTRPIATIGTHQRRPACILRVDDSLQRSHDHRQIGVVA